MHYVCSQGMTVASTGWRLQRQSRVVSLISETAIAARVAYYSHRRWGPLYRKLMACDLAVCVLESLTPEKQWAIPIEGSRPNRPCSPRRHHAAARLLAPPAMKTPPLAAAQLAPTARWDSTGWKMAALHHRSDGLRQVDRPPSRRHPLCRTRWRRCRMDPAGRPRCRPRVSVCSPPTPGNFPSQASHASGVPAHHSIAGAQRTCCR
jgi:hypothetical protein